MITAKDIQRIREEVEEEVKNEYREELRKAYKGILNNTIKVAKSPTISPAPPTPPAEKKKRQRIDPDEQYGMKTYDDTKLFLGPLCAERHDWQGSGKSLRYKSNHRCLLCQRDYNRKKNEINALITAPGDYSKDQVKKLEGLLEIDTKAHYLGNLCSNKHEYQNTGLSLRNKGSRKCVVCTRKQNEKYHKSKAQSKDVVN